MQYASSPMPPLQFKRKRWENASNAHLHFRMIQSSASLNILETSGPELTGTICLKQDHVFCQPHLHLLHRSRFAKDEGEIRGFKLIFTLRLYAVSAPQLQLERMPTGSSVRHNTLARCEIELAL